MKRVMRLLLGLSLLLLNTAIAEGKTTIAEEWQLELCSCLNGLKTGNFLDAAPDGALELQAPILDGRSAIPAIFEMFVRRNYNIELFWWKHENRAVRTFVEALYLCATDEGPSWVPEFNLYIERFNEKERLERKEEQQFIIKYRSALAGVLGKILEKRDKERYKSDFEPYFGSMAKAGLGKRLPKWCRNAKVE